jgi:hypothetical protein
LRKVLDKLEICDYTHDRKKRKEGRMREKQKAKIKK